VSASPLGKVDLSNCDREPIHLLGAIQSFGFLVAMDPAGRIARVSCNLRSFTGHVAESVLGAPIDVLFRKDAVHAIRNRLTLLRSGDAVERLFALELVEGRGPFDVAVHFSGDLLVIEAEPHKGDLVDAVYKVRALTARLAHAPDLQAFQREACRQVRVLTGFDRVMLYRFDHTGAGEVVAEALRQGVDSFLGLSYPASDIPGQVRLLYLRNLFRIIADVDGENSPVLAAPGLEAQPFDQSLSVLRSVSPIHLEYLRNMGVAASLSISIVVEGRLWGLFACHHYKPMLPAFSQRSVAELYGQMYSLMLESRERREASEFEGRAREGVDAMMAAIGQDQSLLARPDWLAAVVMDMMPCDGAGIVVGEAVHLVGLTPSREQFLHLTRVLARYANGRTFSTDEVGKLVPDGASYAHVVAGLLAIPLSRQPRDFIVLFRGERLRTVRWAGNPEKPVQYGPHGARLTPRKSFEEWSETVRGKALPFSTSERRIAQTLHTALSEVLLRFSEHRAEERRKGYEQQQLLIAELNHRVRNIRALIRGLVSQSNTSNVPASEFVVNLDKRIQSLARAHDQLTASRYGPGTVRELLELEVSAYAGPQRSRVILHGGNHLISPAAYTVLALVFHELMTNAVKYGALSDGGRVQVEWRTLDDGSLLLEWKESGGPVVTAPTRTGFGTSIIERSVPHELGGTAEVRFLLSGLEATSCIPTQQLAGFAADRASDTGTHSRMPHASPLRGKRTLLVEDSLLIAMDAEDLLRQLGAVEVLVASSQQAALDALDTGIDFAVLDYNLVGGTSLPIAERLLAHGTPFVMATGYGQDFPLHPNLDGVAVVTKPYSADMLGSAIARVLDTQGG